MTLVEGWVLVTVSRPARSRFIWFAHMMTVETDVGAVKVIVPDVDLLVLGITEVAVAVVVFVTVVMERKEEQKADAVLWTLAILTAASIVEQNPDGLALRRRRSPSGFAPTIVKK